MKTQVKKGHLMTQVLELRARVVSPWTVTPWRAGQERTDQQAALTVQERPYPALSCQSAVAPATWIMLAGRDWRAWSPPPDLPEPTCHEGN